MDGPKIQQDNDHTKVTGHIEVVTVVDVIDPPISTATVHLQIRSVVRDRNDRMEVDILIVLHEVTCHTCRNNPKVWPMIYYD